MAPALKQDLGERRACFRTLSDYFSHVLRSPDALLIVTIHVLIKSVFQVPCHVLPAGEVTSILPLSIARRLGVHHVSEPFASGLVQFHVGGRCCANHTPSAGGSPAGAAAPPGALRRRGRCGETGRTGYQPVAVRPRSGTGRWHAGGPGRQPNPQEAVYAAPASSPSAVTVSPFSSVTVLIVFASPTSSTYLRLPPVPT